MAVDPEISKQIVAEELAAAESASKIHGWTIKVAPDQFTFTVAMKSGIDNEVYIMEVRCDNYKELPPFFEFMLPTGERKVASAYPESTDSFFHSDLVICFPFNRGAYNNYGGPHGDWAITNWQSLCPQATRLGDMLVLIQHRIDSDQYKGRRR